MMTHILSNLPEECQIILEILEDELYDKDKPITIESICEKLLMKFDRMNEKSGPRASREDENLST